MIKNYLLLLALFFISFSNAQIINIPDVNFKAKLLEADITNEIAKDENLTNIKIDLNGDGEIQQSEALKVYRLTVSESNISSLDGIKNFLNLIEFKCGENNIESIDVSYMPNLLSLQCYRNKIVSIDYTGSSNLYELICAENLLTNLDLSSISKLAYLNCGSNQLNNLDVTVLPNLVELWCDWNQLNQLDLSQQNSHIFNTLICSSNKLSSLDIARFNNLKALHCGDNPITKLDITAYSTLESLGYWDTKISNFEVQKFPNLIDLSCTRTETTSLDLTELVKLERLSCGENKLTSLDVSRSINLVMLNCSFNSITKLDLTNFTKLEDLFLDNNKLTNIDLSKLSNLKRFFISDNLVKSIDLSNSHALNSIFIDNNPLLESVFIKNGSIENELYVTSNPNLKYVCADEDQMVEVENSLREGGHVNFTVNSYCSFAPAGESFTIQGYNRNDSDNNGCDTNDIPASFLKFEISDGVKTGRLIANETGNYAIKVSAGSYTIIPVFENPDYFSVFPSSLQVEFPVVASPVLQNFCITPVDSHKDLEITLLPVTVARPGFTADYKIIFKNKGNIAQSGNVNLSFKDSVLDFMDANPGVSSQNSNNLSWNFNNLKPFETREIALTFRVNSPIQTPTVLNGDILNYIATINSSEVDEKPIDNTFALNQTVVGSYDPNDKTCLEGNVITPALIGQYVHYMIRFENTGSYAAENIVVKDMIDLSKFDIATLTPTSASHFYSTKISDGNKVEFIFENINLPFDDASNDGYIAFKIKTLPTLTVGDSFTNEANIYFDYNMPILTNKATSTFKTLGTQDFEFSSYFNIYPVPANNKLNLVTKHEIKIQSLSVYDVLGQLLIAVTDAKSVSDIDVSKLRSGNYILKIRTDKGDSGIKFNKI